jgi:glycosyltransferase involved in cell wall biosynthesis
MKTYKAAVSIASNSPGTPTGYGVQAELLANRLIQDNYDVAALSNYGLEGAIADLKLAAGTIKHYPKGLSLYSGDALKLWHKHFLNKREIPNAILTLYDAWVFNNVPGIDDLNFMSWTPVDHLSLPPNVLKWAKRPNVKTIAMSPFGQREFEKYGVDSFYIPHAVDTKIYKPTSKIRNVNSREYMGLKEDDFLVGMVAANKANTSIHRKAFAENLLAFALFKKSHPNAYLYIHSEVSKAYGGFDLINLIKAVGLNKEDVLFADPAQLRIGYDPKDMAGIYSTMDVLLHVSYGEGFGVPAIEAQACGTKVIGSSWAASPDLLSDDCLIVDGQPFWDEAQMSFFMIPLVPSIVNALETAFKERSAKKTNVEFASQFDADRVYENYWQPFLKAQL